MKFEVFLPVKIIFGRHKISKLGEYCQQFGKRTLVITMKELVALGLVERGLMSLKGAGVDYVICDQIEPEPTAAGIDSLWNEIEMTNADVVVGFGGGSCLDAAKAIAIVATNPGPIWDYIDLRYCPPRPLSNPPLPIVAVPTTSGTGAEVTANAVLINTQTTEKATIKSHFLFPKVAIIDPELTYSLPKKITGMTGFDAFAHASESFINCVKRSPFSDLICQEAMKRIYTYLPRVVDNGADEEGREQLSWSSLLAGIGIAHAGTTVTHALAQPATARLGLPHGLAVAIFTLPVMKHTFRHDKERFAMMANILIPEEASCLSGEEQAELAVKAIERLLKSAGMDQTLSQNGAKEDIIPLLAEDGVTYMGRGLLLHPVQFGKEEIAQIVRESF